MKKSTRNLLLVSMLAVLAVVGIYTINRLKQVDVVSSIPAVGASISPYGAITFTFSRPVQPALVEGLFHSDPACEGSWEWVDEQTGRWTANQALLPDQKIVFELQAGSAGKRGEEIKRTIRWEAQVRQPQILALKTTEDGTEIFAYPLAAGSAGKQLTSTNGAVIDFAASRDGEEILYSLKNGHGGSDLWIMQRDGSEARSLVECGSEWCGSPAWSPVSNEAAYTRKKTASENDAEKTTAWIVDTASGVTSALFSDAEKAGEDPLWSPDGKWIATWNKETNTIQVTERETGKTLLMPSSMGDTGCWSPDSQYLYYPNTISVIASFRNVVVVADIQNGSTVTVLNKSLDEESKDSSIDSPVCSPTEHLVAVKLQPNIKYPGKKLVILDLTPGESIVMGNIDADASLAGMTEISADITGITVMGDLTKIPAYYSWTPTGDRLVYQLSQLGNGDDEMEIWVWDRESQSAEKMISGARYPQWLP